VAARDARSAFGLGFDVNVDFDLGRVAMVKLHPVVMPRARFP
jgi:hypothetical protein